MREITQVDKIVVQTTAPRDIHVAWYNPVDNDFKIFINGLWRAPRDIDTKIVSGSYDKTTNKIILTKSDGTTVEISLNDLGDNYLSVSDNDLETTNKTIVGAINELNAKHLVMESIFTFDDTITDPSTKITSDSGFGVSSAPTENVVSWIRANSHAYVGTMNSAGNKMNLKLLSDTNWDYYADGTDASTDITGPNNQDVFIKLPEFWYKSEDLANGMKMYFSRTSKSGYLHWDGNILIGAYEGYIDGSVLRSISGLVSTGNVSWTNFRIKVRDRNTDLTLSTNEGYRCVTFLAHSIMGMLYYCYYGNTNCQLLCGSGSATNNKATGLKNDFGMTDTDSTTGNTDSIKFWGLENWWGNKYEWIDDLQVDSTDTSKLNVLNLDSTTSELLTIPSGVSNYITLFTTSGKSYLLPSVTNGSDSTGYCDYGLLVAYSGCVAYRSGSKANANGGVGCLGVYGGPSNAYSAVGSRLVYQGPCEIL